MQLDFLQEDAAVTTEEKLPEKKAKKPQTPKDPSLKKEVKKQPVIETGAAELSENSLPPLPKSLRHPFIMDENAKEDSDLEKAPEAFKTISETAKFLDVPQHVLRFWESRFSQIKPLKLNGGRRYYRPHDINILSTIKHLLYKQGYTIKGAKKAFSTEKRLLSEGIAAATPQGVAAAPVADPRHLEQLIQVRQELMDLREHLRSYVGKQPVEA